MICEKYVKKIIMKEEENMIVENGEWTITGLEYDDPSCIHSPQELIEYVKKVGFLRLFGGDRAFLLRNIHGTWAGGQVMQRMILGYGVKR